MPVDSQVISSGSLTTDSISLNNKIADSTQAVFNLKDSTSIGIDSLNKPAGSSMSIEEKEDMLGIKIARDALESVVKSSARDSIVMDLDSSVFYLYGAAKVNYEGIEIVSGKMIFNQKTSIMTADPIRDTADKIISFQEFSQEQEKFTFDTLQYNFKSKRAIVRNARSQYGEGFVISNQVKRNPDESIFGLGNIYTTCNLPHPHFGIRAKKIKVIPNRMIASGPANIEIMDVPTPLFLPFGVFPITKGQRSGFILPTYSIEERRGVGLQKGGYYFAVNDYLGIITQFDVFSKGSWGGTGSAQYNKRYRYRGNLSLNYLYTKYGEEYDPDGSISKDFRVTWTHQMDGRARPGTTFSASVNFGTSSFNYLNGENITNALDNQYSSSISYGKNWVGKPYSFTAAIRHSQSTLSHQVTVALPEMNFNLGQFSPFQRKEMIGDPRWYEKISVSYSVSAINDWKFIDSTLSINNISLNDFSNGIKHNASVSASYSVLRYFTWSLNVPYTEFWNFRQEFRDYDEVNQRTDTLIRNGFFASREFSSSSSLSTRIYGVKMFKKGKVMGLRHVITPSFDVNYQPGFASSPFHYLYARKNAYGEIDYLSPYAYTPIGGPNNAKEVGSVGFNIGNTLQMKLRGTDSVKDRNISLIDRLSINGGYNLFADSNKMSNINLSFGTSILKKINISASASFDPYVYDGPVRTGRYLYEDGGLAKLSYGNMSVGLDFQAKYKEPNKLNDAIEENSQVASLLKDKGYNDYYDFNIPWNLSVNGGIGFSRNRRLNKSDTLIFRPNLTFIGGFNLTERWKVNINSALEFEGVSKVKLGTTNINISRDLHCWQMSLNLVPFGFYRSFIFTLQVKAAVLQDLKLTRRRSYQDNY